MLNRANTQKAFRKLIIKIMSVFFSFFTLPLSQSFSFREKV